MLSNALTYNKSDSPIYKSAYRIRAATGPILQELEQYARRPSRQMSNGDAEQLVEGATNPDQPNAHVGDLEPSLSILDLLLSEDAIKDDTSLILDEDPLSSLMRTELANWKPPPPPPPPKVKPIRDRKAERERRLERQRTMLEDIPVFRAADLAAPRTRSARAAMAAFEAEANATPDSASTPEVEQEGGDGSVPTRKRSRRPPLVLPGQTDIPPVVDDVDNQRSFEMFDEGWILPSSQRRGGRAPIERHEIPPPKKKLRLGTFLILSFYLKLKSSFLRWPKIKVICHQYTGV